MLLLTFIVPAKSENFPFAPKAKYGKHKTKNNHRVHKSIFQYCKFKKVRK